MRAELVLSAGNKSLQYTDDLFVAFMYMTTVIKPWLLSRTSGCEPKVTYLGHIFENGLNEPAVCRAISTHNCSGRWHLSLARPIIVGIEFTAKLHWTLHLTPFNGKKKYVSCIQRLLQAALTSAPALSLQNYNENRSFTFDI